MIHVCVAHASLFVALHGEDDQVKTICGDTMCNSQLRSNWFCKELMVTFSWRRSEHTDQNVVTIHSVGELMTTQLRISDMVSPQTVFSCSTCTCGVLLKMSCFAFERRFCLGPNMHSDLFVCVLMWKINDHRRDPIKIWCTFHFKKI